MGSIERVEHDDAGEEGNKVGSMSRRQWLKKRQGNVIEGPRMSTKET